MLALDLTVVSEYVLAPAVSGRDDKQRKVVAAATARKG
jgi:hypothetical protein